MANDLKLQVLLRVIDRVSGPLRSIEGQSARAVNALKIARDNLKELGATQKQVGEFRQLKQGLTNTRVELELARNKTRELGRQMASTTTPTRAMQREFDNARRTLHELKQQEIGQNQQLNQLRQRLKNAGVDTRNLSEHERRLKQQMADANSQIDTQRQRLQALTKQQQRMTRASRAYQRGQQLAGNLSVNGSGGLSMAYSVGRGLYAPLREGKHFALEEQRVAALGLGKENTDKAIDFAKQMKTYGTSITENLALMRNAMTVLADANEAETFAPTLAKMKFANNAMYGEEQGVHNERTFMGMLKVIEMRGGLASEEAFVRQADIVQRLLTATGGRVGPNEWLNVIKTGGVAAKGIKGEAFYYQMEPLVQELGGHRVGTAMMSAYSNLYQGTTTKRTANNLERLGLVDPKKVKHDKAGQIAFLEVGAIKGSDLFRENQFEWMEKFLLPQLAAKGITDKNKVLDAIGSIFSNHTASNLFAQMYLQRDQIHKNTRRIQDADGIDQLYDKAVGSTQGYELKLLAQKANAYREMSHVVLPTYIDALKNITAAIMELNKWIKENPAGAAAVLKTALVMGGMAAVFGALALALASLIGPFVAIRYALAMLGIKGVGILNLFRGALPMLIQAVRVLVPLLGGALIAALRSVGVALWALAANPMVLAIVAVFALLAGAAYLIYEKWDAVKSYFASAWTEIMAGFDGGISGIVTVLANFNPVGLMYQAFARVLSYLGIDLPSRFTEFGSRIVTGLVNGLYAGLDQIKNAINNIGDSTIAWFKEKLDINSPSRVFAQLGNFTMAGLNQGLVEGSKGPLNAISRLGKQLTASGALAFGTLSTPALAVDMRAPITPVAPANDASNDRYEINIHPAATTDAHAIARAVRVELSRIDSEKSARRRSQLSDLD